jgi:hypothetical protein
MGRAAQDEPVGPLSRIWPATLVLAVTAVVGVLLLARGTDPPGLPPKADVAVRATLDRDTVEFGDAVTANVTVLLDRRAIGSDDVRVHASLAPLTELGRTRVTRMTRGRLFAVTYSSRASCLDQRCIGTGKSKQVVLPPVRVAVPGRGTHTANWPPLQVRTRVLPADVAQPHPPLRSDSTPPPVTYRFEPARLARVLEVAAAVLAAVGVLLAGGAAAAVSRGRRRQAAQLTGLERALALAREAGRRPSPDRRRALGLLARLLGSRDPRLAGAAEELAWSSPAPTPDAVSDLVSRVEREVNGR